MHSQVFPGLILLGLLCAAPVGPRPGAPAASKIQPERPKVVYGCWVEVRKEVDGKVTEEANDLNGWELTTDNAGLWERRGESVYTRLGVARLRTDKKPWWLDILGESPTTGKPRVWPGIARLEKGRLVWVRAPNWEPAPAAGRDCHGRPRGFDVSKQPGYEKVTLTRTDGRYAQD